MNAPGDSASDRNSGNVSAQRLSATLMNAPAGVQGSDRVPLCSTPFGDIDECTLAAMMKPTADLTCSTPFGDIDECTVAATRARDSAKECSTPFGDIDECTRRAPDPDPAGLYVLNAFRRH